MTRKLFVSQRSPFARKIRILLGETKLPYELKLEDLTARSAEFQAISPLGKVPVLVDEDGTLIFDSTVIAEYLEDRYPEPPVLGRGFAERLHHRVFDELADTVADQAVALFFGKDTGAPLDKHEKLLGRALDELAKRIRDGAVPSEFGLAHASLIGALGYLELRLGRARIDARPELERFIAPHLSRPSVQLAPAPTP
jgi:glutathione S-transferase